MATTTTSTVAPEISPYLTYGLQQASGLYQQGGPQYYTGETFPTRCIPERAGRRNPEQASEIDR